jgi:hypothetical protein
MSQPEKALKPPTNLEEAAKFIEVIDGIAWYRGPTTLAELIKELPPVPPEVEDEFHWATHDPEVKKQYGGLVVAVRHHRVWGAGKSYRAAQEQALKTPGCPEPGELVYAIV